MRNALKMRKVGFCLPLRMIEEMDLLVRYESFISRGDIVRTALRPLLKEELKLLKKRNRMPYLMVKK